MGRVIIFAALLFFAGCVMPQGTVKTEFNESGQITLVETRGFKSAVEAPRVILSDNRVEVTAGMPAKPASEAEKSLGSGIKWLFGLTGLLIVGAIACFATSNPRMGINLLLASPIPSVLALLLIKLASLPIWVFILIAAIGGALAAGSIYLYWGYRHGLKSKVDTKE